MIVGLLLCQVVAAAPVVQELSGGEIDWTESVLRVRASAMPHSSQLADRQATEQDVREQLIYRMHELASQVMVEAGVQAGDLLSQPGDLGEVLEQGLSDGGGHWQVVETRYFTSGKVELVSELPLLDWLGPALLEKQTPGEEGEETSGSSTGILVDARQVQVLPSLAPRLLGPDGEVLYGATSTLSRGRAVLAPVMWIGDPADAELGARVGDRPLLVVAVDVRENCDLVLSREDALRVRTIGQHTRLLADAPVAIAVGN